MVESLEDEVHRFVHVAKAEALAELTVFLL